MRTVQEPRPARAADPLPGAGGAAWFGGVLAHDVAEVSSDPGVLDRGGLWAVLVTFEGAVALWRLAARRPSPLPPGAGDAWRGPAPDAWRTSLDREAYVAGVREIRRRIRAGDVYQANLCRVLSAPVPAQASPWDLAARLAVGNPAPYASVLDLPGTAGVAPARIVCASPELFLRRDGDLVTSSPIKGTAPVAAGLTAKDEAENVMIVDLVRNDLQRVCRPGTVEVSRLLDVEQHPGLVHLVSTVRGRLRPATRWPELLAAVAPAGSVSGAPKHSALRTIADLEPSARGPYCGAVGWVDADRDRACLAVGIRTFWWAHGDLRFGTGAGITWGSDPEAEWAETELKARRLVGLASAVTPNGSRTSAEDA